MISGSGVVSRREARRDWVGRQPRQDLARRDGRRGQPVALLYSSYASILGDTYDSGKVSLEHLLLSTNLSKSGRSRRVPRSLLKPVDPLYSSCTSILGVM